MGRARVSSADEKSPWSWDRLPVFVKSAQTAFLTLPHQRKRIKKKTKQNKKNSQNQPKEKKQKQVDVKKIKMFFHAHVFCIAQPTYSKALFPFVTGVHANCEVLQCSGTLRVPSRMEKWRGRWVCLPLLCECPVTQETPGVSEGHLSVSWSSVQNGFLSRVPMLSVYEFRLFFSLYSQRK